MQSVHDVNLEGHHNDLGVGDVVDRGERLAFDSNCFMQNLTTGAIELVVQLAAVAMG